MSTLLSAAEAVVSRLRQMRQLWDDAAASYFEPDRFLLSLQNCITVSRTVTFILQANKREFTDFDQWYSPYQDSWRSDPIMDWVKEARNEIEKRGDLQTYSQVRVEIIAAYLPGPTTEWIPQDLFATPHDIFRSVPKHWIIPHVIENGTLLIERRWVDRNLPNMEVLEALSYVYRKLADMVVSLLKHVKLPVPRQIADTVPDAMGALAMDRAMYLSMKDGSLRGFRYYRKSIETPKGNGKKAIMDRYGMKADWKGLSDAKTLHDVSSTYFNLARIVLKRDGYHSPFAFLMRDSTVIRIVRTDHPDRASRYVLMRDLARLSRIEGANGVMMISEAWTAEGDDIPRSGFAAEAKNRGEALVMNAANAKGESLTFEAKFERRRPGSKKIKKIFETVCYEDGFQFILAPFMMEWGCLDKEKLYSAIKRQDEMGICI